MKLIKAQFKNFRLLKDLQLDFSTNTKKPLTVIRAANETGKTTCEYALMWALYGSKAALPKKGDYPLFPADMKASGEKRVEISVEIEFEVDQIRSVGRGNQEVETCRYRLTRSCIEHADSSDGLRRDSENTTMFKITPEGSDPVSKSEEKIIIENALPETLKDVYFTDGDRAMSFIEAAATTGVKRKRVSNAVEALLGLAILNKTVTHLENVSSKFSQEIDNTDYAKELEKLNDRISGWSEDIETWELDRKDYESRRSTASSELKSLRNNIEDALKLGDKAKLVADLNRVKQQIKRNQQNSEQELVELARLVSCSNVSMGLIKSLAEPAKELLGNLNKEKKLPKVNIPILDELLDRDNCFCGADLSKSTQEGLERRKEIQNSIEASRASDAIQENATGLFYRVRSENFETVRDNWVSDYSALQQSYQNSLASLRDSNIELRQIQQDIDSIDDSCLQELREQEQILTAKWTKITEELSKRATQIEDATQRKKEAEEERQKVEKKVGKSNTSAGKLTLARHSQNVFQVIIDKLKKEELKNVSSEMNRIFIEMIGADPEKNDLTLITKAELTDEYDIVVYGPAGHRLNPDQDLNGASRRAITLAFILALTKVSQVEAPNVIDTPLGMMSGFVKQSVLLQALKEGSQVVLFLTHDEIKGVERILDDYAGIVFTLTNPAHYPKMLVNQPVVTDPRIMRCECDHRSTCSVCERKDAGV